MAKNGNGTKEQPSQKNKENQEPLEGVKDETKESQSNPVISSEGIASVENDKDEPLTFQPVSRKEILAKERVEKAKAKPLEVELLEIDKLDNYNNHPFEIYEGERLDKLAESIDAIGLQNPIIVRPIAKAGYARNPKKIKKHDLHSGLKLAI